MLTKLVALDSFLNTLHMCDKQKLPNATDKIKKTKQKSCEQGHSKMKINIIKIAAEGGRKVASNESTPSVSYSKSRGVITIGLNKTEFF